MYVQLPSMLTVRHDAACVCVCVCVCEALHCTLLCCTVLFYTALYCTCTVLIELCCNSLCVQMSMSSSALYRPWWHIHTDTRSHTHTDTHTVSLKHPHFLININHPHLRPAELVCKIQVPLVMKASLMVLDVAERWARATYATTMSALSCVDYVFADSVLALHNDIILILYSSTVLILCIDTLYRYIYTDLSLTYIDPF